MRVKDIMTSAVQVAGPDDPVETAARTMTVHGVTALPVVGADGLLAGMVSEGDLLWHRVPADPCAHMLRVAAGEDPGRPDTVAEVMSPFVLTTTAYTDIADVAEQMLHHDVRSLPVVDGRSVVGIISRRDILRAVLRGDDILTLEVRHRLDEYADGADRWTVAVEHGVAVVSGPFRNETEEAIVAVLASTVPGVAAARLEVTAVA